MAYSWIILFYTWTSGYMYECGPAEELSHQNENKSYGISFQPIKNDITFICKE
jgi:hypothetical protein